MVKFGLLHYIDPLIKNLQRRFPVLPGQPHLGRPRRYDTWGLVRLWLLAVLAGWSVRQLCLKLADRQVRAYLCHYVKLPPQVPDRRTLDRRFAQADFLEALRLLFQELARRLSLCRPGDLKLLAIDFTDLPVRVKYDPHAAYGYTSKGRFYGYKLHLVVSRCGSLLAYRLATANHHGLLVAEEMVGDLTRFADLVDFLLGDAGYDGKVLHELVHRELKAMLLAPANPRWNKRPPQTFDLATARGRALAFLQTAKGRKLYHQRTIIEQVNGQLKDVLSIARIPYYVRGEPALERLVAARLILYNAAIFKNLRSRKSHVRRVKHLVA